MRFLVLILQLCFSAALIGQQYHWDFAMSTGICPIGPRNYPFDYRELEFLSPIKMEYDYNGNLYVLGKFEPNVLFEKQYQITPSVKVSACGTCQGSSLYMYKISASGEVIWANTISHDVESLGTFGTNTDFTVNPFSGKVYLLNNALDYFYINQDIIFSQFDNSKGAIKKMMLCFNADGSFNKLVGSVFVLDVPHFASANKGVYKASKLSEFYPWDDSASFYVFDAIKDSVTSVKFANYDNILYFDPNKQHYITDQLAEYDVDLVKLSNYKYRHIHNYFAGKVQNHFKDKSGSHYFFYHNTNVGIDYQFRYYFQKLDSNFNRLWVQSSWDPVKIQQDTSGNFWLFVQSNAIYVNELSSGLKNYPTIDKNPSDCYLIKLNSLNGDLTNETIVPTNLIQQTNAPGLFRITKQNEFWISGLLYNEAEFGNYHLKMNCNGNYLPLQHYVAKAKEGWKQNRKNLQLNEPNDLFGLKIYPNPTQDVLYIENPGHIQIQSIEIIDVMGKKVEVAVDDFQQSINLDHLAQGIYFLKITSNNITQTYKICIQ